MRLLLKTKVGIVSLYWVQAKNNSIVGWYAGQCLNNEVNISPDFPPDFHFTYPESGNYHFSVKSFKTDPEIFATVFWDRVKIKTITNAVPSIVEMSKADFESHNLFLLGHLMVGYRPLPVADIMRFSFPTIGFNVLEGDFNRNGYSDFVLESQITDNDLVIDVSLLNNHCINAFGCVRNISQPESSLPSSGGVLHVKSQPISDTHILEICCMSAPNPGI